MTLKVSQDFEANVEKYVLIALNILVTRFISDSRDTPKGQTKFTEASATIGRSIVENFTQEKISTVKQVHVGDCILGAFYEAGYVNIYRDEAYSEHAKKAPYIVEATDYFADLAELPEGVEKDLIRGTETTPIAPVTHMIQPHGRPLIKGYFTMTDASQVAYQQALDQAIEEDAVWLRAVNNLQQTGWMINPEVHAIVEQQFDKMIKPVPPRPGIGSQKAVKDALADLKKADTQTNRDKFNREVKLWNRELESLIPASKNVETSLIRTKAKLLAEMGEFYQYVELDYRGRMYIQEPYMNFQGNDMARGLMMFSEGKPLGLSGYKWLAIHTAASFNQSYGVDELPEWTTTDYSPLLKEQGLESISVDKMTLQDRELWAWKNMDKILEDSKELVECEKPVAYLAACIEWKNAHLEGLTDDFVSHLPIPIDGSCNGYQHSAAIAKDEITGSLVSLTEQDVQADLYVVAAKELVARKPEFFDDRPEMKMKHIRKGIAKRAVMTRAYSAGKEKISESMYRDCHTLGFTEDFDITMLDCMELGHEMYDLIKTVCPGATRTMEFLQKLATYELGTFETFDVNGDKVSKTKKKRMHLKKQRLKKIKEPTLEELKELNEVSALLDSYVTRCTVGNGSRHLSWVTPSGFPVIYEAYITRQIDIKSTIPGFSGGASAQAGRVTHVLQEPTDFPDVQKYQAGISPNVIHSMDATHMAGVIEGWDGSFGAVHDSFSTHAGDVDRLAQLTREKFVEMYNVDDPYAHMAEMILSPCVYDEELPELGTLDIEEVLKSQYFFC